jgi:hypothetical protein
MTVVALLFTLPLQADVIEDLYLATVPVETQDRKERQEAIRTGLSQVLVRVTGSNQVLTSPVIEAALNQPTRYAQRFRYQKHDKDGKKQLMLWMRFDEGAIRKLLTDNQMPVWGRTRPATLLWLVVDDRRTRSLISNDKQADARLIIEEQAKLRGLPLRLPLYDLTDRANLSVADIWGNFEEAILRASSRYQTEAVLVGRVYRTASNSWNGRWTLYIEGRQQSWQTSGDSLEVAMLPGVSQTTGILAQRYAEVDGAMGSDQLLVRIKGVSGLSAYTRVVKYLDSLDAITQVRPQNIDSDSVVFTLTSRRGQLAVSQAIALGHTLVVEPSQPVTQPAQASTPARKNPDSLNPSVDLVYRLVP